LSLKSAGLPNIPSKSLDKRDILGLPADAPVKNTGKAGYNSGSQKVETRPVKKVI